MFTSIASIALLISMGIASPRVVGGQNPTPTQVARLVRFGPPDMACSGLLVAPGWAITAAHCEPVASIGNEVRVGFVSLDDLSTVGIVTDWVVHPVLDLALARIDPPIDTKLTPALIFGHEKPLPGTPWEATIMGWGYRTPKPSQGEWDSDQTVAQIATVSTVTPCKPQYEPAICVTSPFAMTCHGDSGSPLTGPDGAIYGIAQRGTRECPYGGTTTFTDITQAETKTFIEETVAGGIVAKFEWPKKEAKGIGIAGGWAFSDMAEIISPIELWIDNTYAISMPCCSDRGDVSMVFPEAFLLSGFAGIYNWSKLLSHGPHGLQITIIDTLGNQLKLEKNIEVGPP